MMKSSKNDEIFFGRPQGGSRELMLLHSCLSICCSAMGSRCYSERPQFGVKLKDIADDAKRLSLKELLLEGNCINLFMTRSSFHFHFKNEL